MNEPGSLREEASVTILRNYLAHLPASRNRATTLYALTLVAAVVCGVIMRQAIFGLMPLSALVIALVVSAVVLGGTSLVWTRAAAQKWSPDFSTSGLRTAEAKRVMERLCRYGKHLHRAQQTAHEYRAAAETIRLMRSFARTIQDVDFQLSCDVARTDTRWTQTQRQQLSDLDTDTYLRLAVPIQAYATSRAKFGPAVKFGLH
ncbi:MAG: hypothetical protein WKF57_03785 [Nakamurella sp.]